MRGPAAGPRMGRWRRALLRLSAMRCLSCGTEVAEGARFCPSCGQPLRAGADERRIVTVLFADLVGFTTLSESRDPEQVKNLVDRCFERLVADVRAYGGRETPVAAWRAAEAVAPPGHRPRRATTPLIGRDEELGVLRHALATTATRRRAHLVLLLGEAGIGKSRLAEELAAVARAEQSALVLDGRCVPYGEANVWWPVAEAVREACQIDPADPADVSSDKC